MLHHVRRYPRWYAVGVLWLIGMIALPVIESAPRRIFGGETPVVQEESPLTLAPTPPIGGIPVAPFLALTLTAPPVAPGETPLPESPPPEFIEPAFIDTLFDLIPPPQSLPELPPEIQRIIRAAGPIATQGCTGLGLAALVVAVVAPSAEGVPIERILPYLAPVTSVCAYFPIPKLHTVCAADEPLIIDLGGLTKTPPILGLGIDQLTAIEDIVAEMYGDGFPRVSDLAREQLDCHLVDE